MTEEGTTQVSGADIDAVAAKLQHLHEQLPPNEQLVLEWLMARATQAPSPDMQGYALDQSTAPTFSSFFTQSLGLPGAVAPDNRYAYKSAWKYR